MITNNIIYTKFSAYRFNIKKAQDSYIWDDSDKKYIDFTSGWNPVACAMAQKTLEILISIINKK